MKKVSKNLSIGIGNIINKMNTKDVKICVVGLGYVGLPLAVAFGKTQKVYGFDINEERIKSLKQGLDTTNEVDEKDLSQADIEFSSDGDIIKRANFIVVAVPTPIDEQKKPDLTPLLSASKTVGQNMSKGSIVIYESTVYPGCTENDCVPVLEKESGLQYKKDFQIGYSPERINPGDKVHTVDKIVKVVSGSDENTLNIVADVYGQIVSAGIHKAPTIQVAEAAKIIENTQRDVNIALMNELKMIFDKADINWQDVLDAANTKWNFLDFTPGLVGGHCIGVDPYYLATKAEELGHHPEIILAGRHINDDMANYEAQRIIDYINKNKLQVSKILILGATFKPDVPDTRNSKVEDLVNQLKKHNYQIDICEPLVEKDELFSCQNVSIDKIDQYDLVVKAVDHKAFEGVKYNYQILKYNNAK